MTIGLDSSATVKVARATGQQIDSDIRMERFDPALAKYGKQYSSTSLEVIKPKAESIDPVTLFYKHIADKQLKAKSKQRYIQLGTVMEKAGIAKIGYNALEVKQALLKVTTLGETRKILEKLSSACRWGMRHKLVNNNPFDGIHQEMPKPKYQTDPQPNAFSPEEQEQVIQAFKMDKRRGQNYQHYAAIVEFWFLTGCRPSEAIGLTWEDIKEDCTEIHFRGSVQTLNNGQQVWSEGSKNNKTRYFPCTNRLSSLLGSIRPADAKPGSIVFPSPQGGWINYHNFQTKVWNKVVDPIKEGTTPYCCRDTFIRRQIEKGDSIESIARWCDTSVDMIQKCYRDPGKLRHIRPTE